MKSTIIVISILIFTTILSINLKAQVAINTDGSNPDASAILDMSSTDKGVLVPRMATTQRTSISNPAIGLLVFDTTTESFWFNATAGWIELSSTSTLTEIADADADTKIQVEEGTDEDIIRFDISGTEFMRLDSGRLEFVNTGNSIFIGEGAGAGDDFNNLSSIGNIAIGNSAFSNNISSEGNISIGHQALYLNTTGHNNIATGQNALYKNTTGYNNVATGSHALYKNTTGYNNIATGYQALYLNTTGNSNIATGANTLYLNTTGYNNIATGSHALYKNTTGNSNTANGSHALFLNTTGNSNTASGFGALQNNTIGSENTAIGSYANVSSPNLTNATAIGANALVSQDSSLVLGDAAKVGIGTSAPDEKLHVEGSIKMVDGNQANGYVLTSDANGVASWQANDNFTSLTFTDGNQANGYVLTSDANGVASWQANDKTLIADADADTKIQVEEGTDEDIIRFDLGGTEFMRLDSGRLEFVNTGNSVFIGEGAGANDDFSFNFNTGIGQNSLHSNTTGFGNTSIGNDALSSNISGFDNVALGNNSLNNNTTGNHNAATGSYALRFNQTGRNNTASGYAVMHSNTTGINNTASGYRALFSNTTGNDNTAIGYKADVNSNNLINATAIGANALVSQDSSVVLGNAANVGIGTSAPDEKLHVEGSIKMVDGNQANGYVLTSDANGVASWQANDKTLIADADGDTKIQVEESADEDIIRFDLDGTELLIISKNSAGETLINIPNTSQNTFLGKDAGLMNNANANDHNANNNTFIGSLSGSNNGGGYQNTFLGAYSGYDNVSGKDNIFIGYNAGSINEGGNRNSFLGSEAGFSSIGSDNIFLGYRSGYTETGSNKLYIENSASTSPLIYGEFNNDLVKINGDLTITNTLAISDLTFTDGNQTAGAILTSDANGVASWSNSITSDELTIFNSNNINTSVTLKGTTPTSNEHSWEMKTANFSNVIDNIDLAFAYDGVNKMRLLSSGNLEVEGDIDVSGDVNVTGDLEINGKFPVVNDSPMKTFGGNIDESGSISSGNSFTSSKTGTGTYVVTFNTAFTATPFVTVTAFKATGGDFRVAVIDSISTSSFTVKTYNSSGSLKNAPFNFIVLGE